MIALHSGSAKFANIAPQNHLRMRWFLFILFYILIDIYAYQVLRTLIKSQWLGYIYVIISLAVLFNLLYRVAIWDRHEAFDIPSMYAFGIFLVFFVPKVLLALSMGIEDLARLSVGLYDRYISGADNFSMPSRRRFISMLGLGLAAIPFVSFLYGMYKGRYRFRVLDYDLYFDDLPEAFDGYKIIQISDVHSGSFDNHEKIEYAVNLVNEQKGDVILFTGDLVNNKATEMEGWTQLFSTLKAPDGIFSVLGNHDYGDYVQWKSEAEKEANLEHLKKIQREMGWELLLNEHRFLERDGQRIAVVGVENWGSGGFIKAGDVDVASNGLSAQDFKVVMSHDPSYWAEILKNHPKNYQLTLSGHTHGMQFGIEIPGVIKWSPIQYRYENWAGVYENAKRMINVNRGFGYLGYPGRVGIWPEVTSIRLRKGQNANS